MKNLVSIMKDIYLHCSDMQKLADTKNSGLIVFNSAIIIGITKLAIDFSNHMCLFFFFMYIILMCLISIFLNLSSLVAQLRHYEVEAMSFPSENPLFFGKVSQMKPKELVENLIKRYDLKEDETGKYEDDMAKQCIIMGQIALRKFKLFNLAFLWTIAGITTPIGALIYALFYNPNKK